MRSENCVFRTWYTSEKDSAKFKKLYNKLILLNIFVYLLFDDEILNLSRK